jgi:putative heme-binding domain-containing protein
MHPTCLHTFQKAPSPFRSKLHSLRILTFAILVLIASVTWAASDQAVPPTLRILIQALAKTEEPASQLNILRGINAALKGKRDLPPPEGWSALYEKLAASPNEDVRQQAQTLAVVFGGGNALVEMRKTLGDPAAGADRRKAALDSLVSARDAAALPAILELLQAAGPLRRPALHSLAAYDDASIPAAILAVYPTLSSDEKREALSTLVTRAAWARAIIAGIDAKVVARADVSTPLARQLQDLQDPSIAAWLGKNWGAMRSSPADKLQQIARLKAVLTPAFLSGGDPSHGRALFSQTCALCHTLFGAGAKIGPELPGAFEDIDYLLLNIIDPNAIIGKDYQQTVVQTKDGQTLVGIIGEQDASSVTLKSLAGVQTVQRADIASLTVLDTSLMPEGLLSALKDEDVRDLFSYLRLHGQAPILATSANVNDFFNGADLARWIPSRGDAWRVENGEIVGHGNADRPEFLTSDMVAEDFRFTAKLRLTGQNATAEIAFRGQQVDGGFQGSAFRFGDDPLSLVTYAAPSKPAPAPAMTAAPLAPGQWLACEILAKGASVKVLLNGTPALEINHSPGGDRTVFAFHVSGKDSELRLKDVHLELSVK